MGTSIAQNTSKSKCPECNGSDLLQDRITGELICQSCGIVISSNQINTGPEWRAFDSIQREKLPRAGAPATLTLHDKGLSTTISWRDVDASGKKLSPEMRSKLFRLRKWHRRSKVSEGRQRNLSQALTEMSKIQSKLNLPRSVFETCSLIYRKALKSNLVRGRTIRNMVAACIYMACRQCGVVRSLGEVADSGDVSKKDLTRNYRFLLRELDVSVPSFDSQSYVGQIIGKLGLSGETEILAKTILHQASLIKLTSGRGPAGMAGACVYISTKITGEFRVQADIAQAAQVTEVTIRNRYKDLFMNLNIVIKL